MTFKIQKYSWGGTCQYEALEIFPNFSGSQGVGGVCPPRPHPNLTYASTYSRLMQLSSKMLEERNLFEKITSPCCYLINYHISGFLEINNIFHLVCTSTKTTAAVEKITTNKRFEFASLELSWHISLLWQTNMSISLVVESSVQLHTLKAFKK